MRRPGRPPRLTSEAFEALVAEALDELPETFHRRLDNVVVKVEDEPEPEDYDMTGTPDDEELFGVFREVPSLPAQVVVFRGPILRSSRNNREAVREIKDTVVHELGHYFGLEDDEMP